MSAPRPITIYGIRNCDTVQRALAHVDGLGLAYRFHDFKREGLSRELAQCWIAALGVEGLLNRRGTAWRKLDAATQAGFDGAQAAELLMAHPSVIKRPVIERGGELRVGFPKGDEAALTAWLRGKS